MAELPESEEIVDSLKLKSLAGICNHFLNDTVIIVHFFHAGDGKLAGDDGVKRFKNELSPEQARYDIDRLKQRFLSQMRSIDFSKTHSEGPIDKAFVESLISLAEGDWNDPTIIQQLMVKLRFVGRFS